MTIRTFIFWNMAAWIFIMVLPTSVVDSSSIFGMSGGSTSNVVQLTKGLHQKTISIKKSPSSILIPSPINTAANANDKNDNTNIMVVKRDGTLQPLDPNKILARLQHLTTLNEDDALDVDRLDLDALVNSVIQGTYPNVSTHELDVHLAESTAALGTQHYDYTRLAARVLVSQNHKTTPPTFSLAVKKAYRDGSGFVHADLADLVQRHANLIDSHIVHERDYHLTYLGFKTLERAYLLRDDDNNIVERMQYLWMRVALGIHCTNITNTNFDLETPVSSSLNTILNSDDDSNNSITDTEEERLQAAFETYDCLSRGYFTHASPTLFHAGTTHPQLSSCFLVQMLEDSIQGIYATLQQCAVISKAAGGIGLAVHNIRARGTPIRGTRGVSNGLVPMLRVYDVTSRYVDQGGGKRPGAFAVYIEPWHADIFEVLNLKKNHGKEEHRARDLFYGLWVPDLFMRRVQEDGVWTLMCPSVCPDLHQCHGTAFESLYQQYERDGKFVRQVRARELWSAILESQIETGTPYMLYKDACNTKSNQNNLGTIQCSNLCTEIIQYTSKDEVAVCNLASICLARFVVSDRGPFGSVNPESQQQQRAYFDHAELHRITKIVTRNLNRIIDINSNPVEESKRSNLRHRPIGIGVSGLADAFLRLGLPFTSPEAQRLNEAIFETIYHAALEASVELAEKYGAYDTFKGSLLSKGILQFELWNTTDEETPSHRYARNEFSCPKMLYSELNPQGRYDWQSLRQKIVKTGTRNSLLVAPMPTASTSQILGVNECFEPFSSNLYIRRVKAGEFIMANPHLLKDLTDRGLWTPAVRNQMMRDGGSVQNIAEIPDRLKQLYKTVWEIKMKDIIDMAADRGKFIDQSQSLNLFVADPNMDKLTAMHFYAWKKGLKTGMYYLRTKPAVNAIQYTVDKSATTAASLTGMQIPESIPDDVCLSCSS